MQCSDSSSSLNPSARVHFLGLPEKHPDFFRSDPQLSGVWIAFECMLTSSAGGW